MANLSTDPDDDLPPNSGSPQQSDMNRKHHTEMASNLIENSLRAGHGGHLAGKAGPGKTGHTMPPNDAHLQKGAYIKQGDRRPHAAVHQLGRRGIRRAATSPMPMIMGRSTNDQGEKNTAVQDQRRPRP